MRATKTGVGREHAEKPKDHSSSSLRASASISASSALSKAASLMQTHSLIIMPSTAEIFEKSYSSFASVMR